jgi:hypothetical protein
MTNLDSAADIINFVWSCERAMPAHFTSINERTQTFALNSDLIDINDDYEMASVCWYSINDIITDKEVTKDQNKMMVLLRCGEDLMVSSYLTEKLGKHEYLEEIFNGLIKMNSESWPPEMDVPELFNNSSAIKWFNYCREFGMKIALKNSDV